MKYPFFIAAALCLFIAGNADAREREREGNFETGNGKRGSFSSKQSGERGSWSNQKTITTEGGKTINRSSTTTRDKETGAFTREVKGPKGETRTYTGTGEGGERSGTYTTSTGKSGTFDSKATRDENGNILKEESWTDENGVTHTRSVTESYDKDTGTITRSVTGPEGKTRSGTVKIVP